MQYNMIKLTVFPMDLSFKGSLLIMTPEFSRGQSAVLEGHKKTLLLQLNHAMWVNLLSCV